MKKVTVVLVSVAALFLAGIVVWQTREVAVEASLAPVAPGVDVAPSSIGGVVVNSNGQKPEAGVWVIAQTTDLPTPFRRIVVTDDQGQFVVPDLPQAAYQVWVRGYGLRDSDPLPASRGAQVKLQVASARDALEAAKIYPGNYWMSLWQPPAKEELPHEYTSRDHWIAEWKQGCNHCHMVGMPASRVWSRPEEWDHVWDRQANMGRTADELGREPMKKSLADWVQRIRAGEVPVAPPRPAGVERNIVVTVWDWGVENSFVHDLTSTDKRNPRLYPYGKVYGVDMSEETVWALDPVKHTITAHKIPVRERKGYNPELNYQYDGIRADNWSANPHNPMLDDRGRMWMTTQVRGGTREDLPRWAKSVIATDTGTEADLDKAYELYLKSGHRRNLGYLDTKTGQFVLVNTAFGTHHLQFDSEGRIWTTGDSTILGMLDTAKLNPDDPETTEVKAQTAWMKIDPETGKSAGGGGYGLIVSPVDGTVWRAFTQGDGPANKISKFDPKTRQFKDYPLPAPGRLPRGIDATTDGKLWVATGSGHLGRFDPATEQFKYWDLPGPKLKGTGAETGSAEFPYYLWVDQFDALGLGKNMVIVTGTVSDSFIVFDPAKETFVVIRVPYPMPFYARGLDGRIDDPNAGWKGRGLWGAYSSYKTSFTETRKGYVAHVQLRPSPLAQ